LTTILKYVYYVFLSLRNFEKERKCMFLGVDCSSDVRKLFDGDWNVLGGKVGRKISLGARLD